MYNKGKNILFTALVVLTACLPYCLFAQIPGDTLGKLRIESSEVGEAFMESGREKRKLSGTVRLRQDSTLIFCDTAILDLDDALLIGNVVIEQGDSLRIFGDSARYFGATNRSDLYGETALENGRQKLFTRKMSYDLERKIAEYHEGARMTDGQTQLKSRHGYYFVKEDQIYFKEDVVVTDPEFTVRTDTMGFQTKTRTVQFLAPTLITQIGTKIYCEGGYYDTENDYAEFNLNPQYERAGQRGRAQKMRYIGASKEYILEDSAYVEEPAEQRVTKADLIRYNTEKETAVLVGNAYYRDSTQEVEGAEIRYFSREKRFQLAGRGRVSDPPNIIEADSLDFNEELGGGLAVGNVYWRDTAANFSILAWRMDYNKQSEYLNAFGATDAATGRPLMKILVEKDTLYMSADTLTAFKPDSTADSRVLLAHLDVRIFKSNLQASCDSLRFSTADSIFWFYPLQNKPIIWSDTSQFSADTIRMAMRDGKVDRIWLRENSLVINSPDEQFYNQIKGRNNTIFFVDNEVDQMLVEGNAQAVYYALDDDQAYIGVNETACSEMRLFFGDNKVSSIRFYGQPDGKFTPMKEADNNSIRLEGFFWETERRPRRLEDILLKKR